MFFSKKLLKYKSINHCFFSRKNGFSKGIYSSLNCGAGSQDSKENISKNLKYIQEKIGTETNKIILMNQTHSNKVILIDKSNIKQKEFNADAIITKLNDVVLGVLTADCVPIILYDEENEIIGCIHAGWRGCITGIIENTMDKLRSINKNNNVLACVGPCIGNQSYEVDIDFYENFINQSKKNVLFFKNKSEKKYLFDIRFFVNNKLKEIGVKDIDNIDMDTFQDHDNFYSYRRSKKLNELDYGRCISTICLKT